MRIVDLNVTRESSRWIWGPSWFIESKGFEFTKCDQLEVIGSKLADQNAIIAREIKKNNKDLTLQNGQGIPEWSPAIIDISELSNNHCIDRQCCGQ